jgi:hypothetical protein
MELSLVIACNNVISNFAAIVCLTLRVIDPSRRIGTISGNNKPFPIKYSTHIDVTFSLESQLPLTFTTMPKADEPTVVLQWGGDSVTGPATTAPPAFDDIAGHTVVDFNPGNQSVPWGAEQPPAFTPYVAKYQASGDRIISHDPHLNDDGA